MKIGIVIIGICILFLSGCEKKQNVQQLSGQDSLLVAQIIKFRQEKDAYFKNEQASPIPAEKKKSFKGLNYYPPAPQYAFKLPLHIYPDAKPDTIYGTKGDARPAQKYGYFEFKTDSGDFRLDVYKVFSGGKDTTSYLFLGFTDKTTGLETYGAGRYVEPELTDSANFYLIDFNKAYNPYCAYNHRYSCAIPPPQNLIPFKLLAGEKNYDSTFHE
ncbi:MAG: DUF1684 domain-containing protein [Calditrichia bacterium]